MSSTHLSRPGSTTSSVTPSVDSTSARPSPPTSSLSPPPALASPPTRPSSPPAAPPSEHVSPAPSHCARSLWRRRHGVWRRSESSGTRDMCGLPTTRPWSCCSGPMHSTANASSLSASSVSPRSLSLHVRTTLWVLALTLWRRCSWRNATTPLSSPRSASTSSPPTISRCRATLASPSFRAPTSSTWNATAGPRSHTWTPWPSTSESRRKRAGSHTVLCQRSE
mmetsp:Transcript_52459/g.79610  ORF Transcript_52459/g.79610 Transcript_52459/m.79610 type:complete len:223 (+) Transcript_52459:529-1197(+)